MPYFANVSQRGPMKYRDVPGSIGVLESRDNPMPIGQADCKTWDENGLAVWVLSGWQPFAAAAAQTGLLVTMNSGGLLWARQIIPDPGGMVVKNFAFLVLVWVSASLPGRT